MLDLESSDLQDVIIGSSEKERGKFPNFSKLKFGSEKKNGRNKKLIRLDLKNIFK